MNPARETLSGQALRVLLVEDSEDDALLILDALRGGGIEASMERVATARGMRDAIGGAQWDLVLSDFRLPEFNAIQAFAVYREFGLDIPFLIVSGAIGEETAAAAMKTGVHDYISKNNLVRLAPAVQRELREAESRRQHVRAEAALHTAYDELAAIHANIPVLLLMVDEHLKVKSANELSSRLSGLHPANIAGLLMGGAIGCANHLGNPVGCGQAGMCPPCRIRGIVEDTLAVGTRHENVEAWVPVLMNGSLAERCLLVTSAIIDSRPPKKALVCAQDVTELKLAQRALEQSHGELLALNRDLDRRLDELRKVLEEKDVLSREVQHRVKNNLTVISSLLSLQAEQSPSAQTRKVLAESRDRVRSMALIHEQLSHSAHIGEIDFNQYVDRLIRHLLNGYGIAPEQLDVHPSVDALLTLDQAVPCGLIVQELLSNSLNHGLTEGAGEIFIDFHRGNGEYKLNYRDTGPGLPPGFEIGKCETLGMQLVSDLTAQLHGSIRCFTDGGAHFEITFPAERR